MPKKLIYSIFILLFCAWSIHAQETDELIIKKDSVAVKKKPIRFNQEIDPLSPSRAAFYSAILPGLGQIYNKKWWKAPIVWAAVGTGIYFYVQNDDEFNRYRTAFKLRRAGRPDEFDGVSGNGAFISEDGLERAQNVFKENRDLSLFITIGLYALNILEANVDAHLPDKALDTRLSFRPKVFVETITNQPMVGLSMNFKF